MKELLEILDFTNNEQYRQYQNNGGTMTIDEWEHDGRFDPSYNPVSNG